MYASIFLRCQSSTLPDRRFGHINNVGEIRNARKSLIYVCIGYVKGTVYVNYANKRFKIRILCVLNALKRIPKILIVDLSLITLKALFRDVTANYPVITG